MTETTATFTAGFDRYVCHGDTTTAEHDGWTFAAEVHRDDSFGAPWLEHDGHGEVTDWTTRDKAPGELVLAGILERQADELKAAYAPWLKLEVSDSEEGWILMTATAPAASA